MLLSVSETEFPSEQLLSDTDGDLASSIPVPTSNTDSLRELAVSRIIGGTFFPGGCRQWATEKIVSLFPISVALRSLDTRLSAAVKENEPKNRAMLDAEWLNCLTSAAGTTAKLKGYDDPSTLQMAFGSEAPQIATRNATLPKEARRLLSLRLETEKVVIVEARRCAAKTDYFDRLTELRSASLATVLADDKVKDALDFDIDQIRVPLDG